MRDIEKYIWVPILVSGVILLISFLTPVSYFYQLGYGESYIWLWGLGYYNYYEYGSMIYFSFIDDPLYLSLTASLIFLFMSIIILLSSLVLIIMSNKIRIGRTSVKDKESKLTKLGIYMIIIPIIYVICRYIFGNLFYDYIGAPYQFVLWEGASNPGFAFIGPLIGGTLVITTAYISKKKISEKDIITSDEESSLIKKPIYPQFGQKTNKEKYIWSVILIGGIVSLISFFTPAFYADLYTIEEYFWMWGLHYGSISGYGSAIAFIFTQEPSLYMIPIFISGLIPAIAILLCSVMLSTTANSIRKERSNLKSMANRLIGLGITLILVTIAFLIAISITMNALINSLFDDPLIDYAIPDMWDIYQPGFGIIGPFIGAILVIIGGVASKGIKPQEETFITEGIKKPGTTIPTEIKLEQINFCPECGQKILMKEGKFCTYCGFEFDINSKEEFTNS